MINRIYKTLIITSFLILAGCQSFQGGNFFQLQPDDRSLTGRVYETFSSNKLLAELPIQVEVSNGIVFLNGYVKTIRQSDTAGDVAAKVPGVKTVENNLIVKK